MPQDINQSFDIPLHDIKTIVEIQEYSMFYFLALIFAGIVFLSAIVYLIYKWFKARNAFNVRREHFKTIKKLNLNNTKESAYSITLLGATFKDDSPRHSQMYDNLAKRLQEYKYKKEVDKFDSEVLGYIEVYKGMIDV
jgi:hypothetical protein